MTTASHRTLALSLLALLLPSCAPKMKMINGAPHYATERPCLTKTYPEIDAALAPLAATFVPAAVARLDNAWWSCGGAVKWTARPVTLKACTDQSRTIRKALDAATKATPPERRPQGVIGAELQCFDLTPPPHQSMTGRMSTTQENLRDLKAVALDPGGDFGSWNLAWMKLHAIDDFRDHFDVEDLIDSLSASDDRVRLNAVHSLGALGDAAVEATSELKRRLKDPSAAVRQRVPWAIGQVNGGQAAEVPFLLGLLYDYDGLIGQSAISGLGEVGPAAAEAIPALEAIANDVSRHAHWHTLANDALARIRGRQKVTP